MRIIPRSEWGAAPPEYASRLASSKLGWIGHWNGPPPPAHMTGAQIMRSDQRYHQNTKGWSDIAYNFGIHEGQIYEGRGWGIVGGATSGKYMGSGPSNNQNSHAVVFLIGVGQLPSQEDLLALSWLMDQGVARGVPRRITAHRVAAPALSTSCPGPELTNHFKTPIPIFNKAGSIMNEAIVETLYTDFLGRPADPAGKAYWVQRLNEGLPVDAVRWQFVTVRFAALQAQIDAVAAAPSEGVPSDFTERAGREAYNRFLDALQDLPKQ